VCVGEEWNMAKEEGVDYAGINSSQP